MRTGLKRIITQVILNSIIWIDDKDSYPLNKTVTCCDEVSMRKHHEGRAVTDEQVRRIRYLRNEEKKTLAEIKEEMGLTTSLTLLSRIARYKNYQDVE